MMPASHDPPAPAEFPPRLLRAHAPGSSGERRAPSWIAPDVLDDAARRLALVGLVYAIGNLVGLVVEESFTALGWMSERIRLARNLSEIAGMALGLGVFLFGRRARLDTTRIVLLGLIFEVVGGFLVVFPEAVHHVLMRPQALDVTQVSWLTVWIAVFPMLLPASPPVTVFVALLTASTAPLATWVATAGGHPWPEPALLLLHWVPSYAIALLSAVPAVALQRLRRQVSEARAMGNYRLEERLGKGGMGEVWRARHSLLARPAAIKLIAPRALASASPAQVEELKRRFEREAQATASLTSPHTVALFDYGVTEDGVFFYVMELLEGLDLERLVQRHGPQPPERVVHLLRQACDSLSEAHARGLVHRDIKPSNLHACRAGMRHDFVKILDFGLVLRASPERAHDTRLTLADLAIGTPATMAPEIILGRAANTQSDLYALGCVAYWLLTGHEVFEGRSAIEVMSQHAHTPAGPPSKRAPGPVPAELDALVLSCLQKDPALRPRDATEVARALDAVPLARPWTEERAAEWWSALADKVRVPAASPEPVSPS